MNWLDKAVSMFDNGNHKDGDILSHDWIKYALDIPEPKTVSEHEEIMWLTLSRVEAFKAYLLTERKIAIKSVRGKGYWIVPPSDQAEVAAQTAMAYISKGIKKGSQLIVNARLSDMDDDAKKRHTDTHVRLCGINDLIKRQRKDVLSLFKPE